MNALLYRGVGNAKWGLDTTLERAYPFELSRNIETLDAYYSYAVASKAYIETLTDRTWDGTPELDEFLNSLRDEYSLGGRMFFSKNVEAYRYLAYLRHHGYPSPLLDWTESPYIAAFFAFDGMDRRTKRVAVYALFSDTISTVTSGRPEIIPLGPNLRSHRRHTIQQSSYTICTIWEPKRVLYAHDKALAERPDLFGIAGSAVRITLPASERTAALKKLDHMNINAYSLMGSDDALSRTVARRTGLFRFLQGN